jgi:hypothetical protein
MALVAGEITLLSGNVSSRAHETSSSGVQSSVTVVGTADLGPKLVAPELS